MTSNWIPKAATQEGLSRQIEVLSNDLADISRRLGNSDIELLPEPPQKRSASDNELAETVRSMIRARQRRSKHFAPELFADPAWEMMLDLFATELLQHRTTIGHLCIASQVPATTALRWIASLTERGMFIRHADPLDARRVYVQLSRATFTEMCAYFSSISGEPSGAGPRINRLETTSRPHLA